MADQSIDNNVTEKSADSKAELALCRILCVPKQSTVIPTRNTETRKAQSTFSKAMLISATRCLLTYIILPFLAPLIGLSASVGPAIGIPLALVALFFDVVGIRRFFIAKHKNRWIFAWIYLAVIGLVLALLGINVYDVIK
ncbi:MAG: hypothetical protein M1374_07565 [Firmicutes bacterium]|nr:hypothetical protein [Bacillota bacterium]